jgi:hypothetical protein
MEKKIMPEWKFLLAVIALGFLLVIGLVAWLIKSGISLLGAALSPRYVKASRSRK